MGLFGSLFDLNNDGKMNAVEKAFEYHTVTGYDDEDELDEVNGVLEDVDEDDEYDDDFDDDDDDI